MARAIAACFLVCSAGAHQPMAEEIRSSACGIGMQEDASALLQLDKPIKHAPVLVQTAAQVYSKISHAVEGADKAAADVVAAHLGVLHGRRKISEVAGAPDVPDWAESAQAKVAALGGDVVDQVGGDVVEKFDVDNVTDALGDISDTVSAATDRVGADEYIGRMQGLVRDFSGQARSRAANAMASLEGQTGDSDKTFVVSAAATIVETGEVAENMAEQFVEQMQAGRDEVADALASLNVTNQTDEAVISERLQPPVDFLVELLGGTSQLMGSSLEMLRDSRDPATGDAKVRTKGMALFLVPGDLAARAQQSLDDADASLLMMPVFAERLRVSVQKTSNLGDRFIDASGESASSLQRKLVDAARQVFDLLSSDFVAEESARRLAEARSAAFRSRGMPLLAGLVLAALMA